jgi:L-phenylalanine/L-methionine N-acetyltransferase
MTMNVATVVMRHAAIGDAEALSKFMDAIADEKLDTISGLRFSPEEELQFIEKAAKNGRAFLLIALDAHEVIGMLDLWAGDKPHNRHMGRLGTSVLAPYRRKGIGRKLLENAIDDARKWPGFCRIELDVVPWNTPAIRLYESVGFVREATKRKAAVFGDKVIDLVQMALVW